LRKCIQTLIKILPDWIVIIKHSSLGDLVKINKDINMKELIKELKGKLFDVMLESSDFNLEILNENKSEVELIEENSLNNNFDYFKPKIQKNIMKINESKNIVFEDLSNDYLDEITNKHVDLIYLYPSKSKEYLGKEEFNSYMEESVNQCIFFEKEDELKKTELEDKNFTKLSEKTRLTVENTLNKNYKPTGLDKNK